MMTLLEKILKRREKAAPNEKLTPQFIEEAQVLVAWIEGKVDSAEVVQALSLTHTSGIAQKAGTAMRTLSTNGYISILWNAPMANE